MKIFSATLKGTTTVSQGTTNLSGSFTGSFSGSLAGIAGDVSDYSSSVALRTTTLEAASSSFSTRTTNIERVYATTGSNTFTGAQVIQGTLTAQTLVVQTITSSVLFTTGSNKIGSLLSNVQELTGSVGITGSLSVNTNGLFVSSSGNVGIGNVSPTVALDVTGAGKFSGALTVSGAINLSSSAVFPTVGLFNRTSDTTLYMVTAPTGFTLLDNSQNTMYGATPTSHIWNINNSEKMRINSSGSVGIGTSSPTGTYGKLSVAGGISILNDNNAKLEIGRYSSGAPNSYIKLGANSDSLRITNNNDSADIFTITNSGNVGIGVTPSAWASPTAGKVIQLGNRASIFSYNNSTIDIASNLYFNGSDYIYIETAFSTLYRQGSSDGTHSWFSAASGTAGTSIVFSERMRITGGGYTKATNNSSYYNSAAGLFHEFVQSTANQDSMWIYNTSSSGYGITINMPSTSANGTNYFLRTLSATTSYYLYTNGVSTFSSDRNLKKNIETTRNGYLEDLMNLRIVKYNWNTQKDGEAKELGLIAQEVEQVFPSLVVDQSIPKTREIKQEDGSIINEEYEVTQKGLKASVLPFILIKAIQEQQVQIQEQQAQIDELKAKLQ